MILAELLAYRNRLSDKLRDDENSDRDGGAINGQARMTINVLATMAITFIVTMTAMLALVSSGIEQAIVAAAVATGAAFINLVRRPPEEVEG